jgi:hypothetical protein
VSTKQKLIILTTTPSSCTLVGLNYRCTLDDFRELDFDDQVMVKKWLDSRKSKRRRARFWRARRFDFGMLVDHEIIGSFINRSFLDPEDDRVLDEMLNHEIGGGPASSGPRQKRPTARDAPARQQEVSAVTEAGNLPVQHSTSRPRRGSGDPAHGLGCRRILKDLRCHLMAGKSKQGQDGCRAG